MMALGMVEVVGLPPAIEAADAALKAANVTLLSIAKADAGILTVEITGDVDAVYAAVDAGAKAAQQIGTLRTKHVIPRVDEMLQGTVLTQGTKLFLNKNKTPKEFSPKTTEPEVEPEVEPEQAPEKTPEKTTEPEVEPITAMHPIYQAAELKKKSNEFLRKLLEQYGVQLSTFGEGMKKQDLISLILKEQNKE